MVTGSTANMHVGKEKFIALDWLRFLLAIYLVLFHTFKEYESIRNLPWLHSLLSLGFFSTSTFFVLSGFLLTHVYMNGQSKARLNAKVFWIKRFSALYPIHIFALIISLPLIASTSTHFGSIEVTLNTNPWYINNSQFDSYPLGLGAFLVNLGLNISLLHAWNPLYTAFNSPSWSLSALMFFYLLFPFCAPRMARIQRPFLWLVIICMLYMLPTFYLLHSHIHDVIVHGVMHRNPLMRLPEFLAGIVLYGVFMRHRQFLARLLTPAGTCLAMAFIITSIAMTTYLHKEVGGNWYYVVHNGVLLPAQLLLVLLCAWFRPVPDSALSKIGIRLGATALSIFALHEPLNIIASKAEKLVLAFFEIITTDASFSSIITIASNESRTILMYPIYLLVMVVISVIFQEKVVNPTRNILRSYLLPDKKLYSSTKEDRGLSLLKNSANYQGATSKKL